MKEKAKEGKKYLKIFTPELLNLLKHFHINYLPNAYQEAGYRLPDSSGNFYYFKNNSNESFYLEYNTELTKNFLVVLNNILATLGYEQCEDEKIYENLNNPKLSFFTSDSPRKFVKGYEEQEIIRIRWVSATSIISIEEKDKDLKNIMLTELGKFIEKEKETQKFFKKFRIFLETTYFPMVNCGKRFNFETIIKEKKEFDFFCTNEEIRKYLTYYLEKAVQALGHNNNITVSDNSNKKCILVAINNLQLKTLLPDGILQEKFYNIREKKPFIEEKEEKNKSQTRERRNSLSSEKGGNLGIELQRVNNPIKRHPSQDDILVGIKNSGKRM